MTHHEGLAGIAPRYGGFVVDLWGVVHDGVRPYPGALDCLRRLREIGPVFLLSNAPRRVGVAAEALAGMGVVDCYDGLMTSGEATWSILAWMGAKRIHHLGPARDLSVVEGLDVTLTDRPEDADLLLNTGPDDSGDASRIEPFLPGLHRCRVLGLPMLCANPDLVLLRGTTRLICAGTLAEWYEAQGGAVRWIGKPHPEIYGRCSTASAAAGR